MRRLKSRPCVYYLSAWVTERRDGETIRRPAVSHLIGRVPHSYAVMYEEADQCVVAMTASDRVHAWLQEQCLKTIMVLAQLYRLDDTCFVRSVQVQ